MLEHYDHVPDALLHATSIELKKILGGPALFFIAGKRNPPLFVTVLQHGNEPTGFEAIQQILLKYQGRELPRSLWLFIANVDASANGLRTLDDQHDYNRSWPGTLAPEANESKLMRQVVETVTAAPLFASVDLHNNSGSNPHYGCVNHLAPEYLQLATLFSRTVVFFQQPVGVQSLAMAPHCPAVTLECGQAGENAALVRTIEFLDACLHLHHIPKHPVAAHDVSIVRTIAVAKMRPGLSFGFDDLSLDVCFRSDLDKLNFGRLDKGEILAQVQKETDLPIIVVDDAGNDIASQLFEISEGQLITKSPVMPSMATMDVNIIRQDCLFYVMEQMDIPGL